MDTRQERLSRLDSALLDKRQICSSEGVLCAFPSALKSPFMIDGVGLIICRQGSFTFILNQKTFSAKAGDTLFLPKDSLFQVLQASDNVEVYIFIYQTDPIRDFMGNSVVSMHLYSHLATEPCYVWNTGEEEEVLKYLSLLDSTLKIEEMLSATKSSREQSQPYPALRVPSTHWFLLTIQPETSSKYNNAYPYASTSPIFPKKITKNLLPV